MTRRQTELGYLVGVGLAAGVVGTAIISALQAFDERYAPKTIPPTTQDPADFMVQRAERLAQVEGKVPKAVEKSAMLMTRTGYGTMFGVLYGLWHGPKTCRRPVVDGVLLGSLVYLAGYLGWLPALGLSKPVWRQSFPQIMGELARHLVYGVTTTAVYGLIDEAA
ncbi:MAG TPA: hypothetical protein VMD30_07765 [Tepidisphaeraceae bacterium]|nr:hypothetical protein [Tepidisphaeraceae bacterium]